MVPQRLAAFADQKHRFAYAKAYGTLNKYDLAAIIFTKA
jgi:hypothetical protein